MFSADPVTLYTEEGAKPIVKVSIQSQNTPGKQDMFRTWKKVCSLLLRPYHIVSAKKISITVCLSYSCAAQFPSCSDEEAISVACLDLHYSVTVDEDSDEKEEAYPALAMKDFQGEGRRLSDEIDTAGWKIVHIIQVCVIIIILTSSQQCNTLTFNTISVKK